MAGSTEKRGKDTYRLVYACGYNLDGSIAKYAKTVHCNKKKTEIELTKFVINVHSSYYSKKISITWDSNIISISSLREYELNSIKL